MIPKAAMFFSVYNPMLVGSGFVCMSIYHRGNPAHAWSLAAASAIMFVTSIWAAIMVNRIKKRHGQKGGRP